jgi:hypothetical protein
MTIRAALDGGAHSLLDLTLPLCQIMHTSLERGDAPAASQLGGPPILYHCKRLTPLRLRSDRPLYRRCSVGSSLASPRVSRTRR